MEQDCSERRGQRTGRLAGLLLAIITGWQAASVHAQDPLPDVPEPAAAANGDQSESKVPEHVSADAVTPDPVIRKRLLEILRATGWFENVEVEVNQSVVFLRGATEQDKRRQWASDLASNTEDVAAVVNQIEVRDQVTWSESLDIVIGSIESLWSDLLARSPLILAGLLVIALTILISRVSRMIVVRVMKKSGLRGGLQDLMQQLVSIGVWIVGLLIAAVVVFPGMTPGKAITVLGLGSVAIGFAFKDIFENFFAGVLILWRYPFDRGDFIRCEEITGKIEEITVRMTMIRQVDGQLIVVPNAMLFKNPVDVLTSRRSRRTTILCGVAYDADLAEAQRLIRSAVEECSSVDGNEAVEIFAQELADSSINFEVTWWTGSTPLDIRQSRDEIVQAVKTALDNAGIEIPFPQRTLWLPEPVETRSTPADKST